MELFLQNKVAGSAFDQIKQQSILWQGGTWDGAG